MNKAERITFDELVRDTVENRLHRKEWQELLLFGESHAQARKLSEADIQNAITAIRSAPVRHEL